MLQKCCMAFDISVIVLVSVIASVAVHLLTHWDSNRRIYSLECDVADLQNKVLNEVKKRAQVDSVKARKGGDELLEKLEKAIAETKLPAQQPWWMAHVPQEAKKS